MIVVATGSGIAPVTALLQRKVFDMRKADSSAKASIDPCIGFSQEDTELMDEIVRPAKEAGLLNILEMVPSNELKERVQDRLLDPKIKEHLVKVLEQPGATIFVCANDAAAEGTIKNLSSVAGEVITEMLGERLTRESFSG